MSNTFFAPQLIVQDGAAAIEFYKKAFDVKELRRWNNDDGSVHVAELSFNGAMFHIKQESVGQSRLSPATANGYTTIIGIFVDDVDTIVDKAVKQGATLLNAAQDYDYGYRQADIKDPFGHEWLIEKRIS
jgi:PhnB protein